MALHSYLCSVGGRHLAAAILLSSETPCRFARGLPVHRDDFIQLRRPSDRRHSMRTVLVPSRCKESSECLRLDDLDFRLSIYAIHYLYTRSKFSLLGHPLEQEKECFALLRELAKMSKLPAFLFSHLALTRTNANFFQNIPHISKEKEFPIAIYRYFYILC